MSEPAPSELEILLVEAREFVDFVANRERSDENFIVSLVLRSKADELRREADRIERADARIDRARALQARIRKLLP